jgi:hypothetical protein
MTSHDENDELTGAGAYEVLKEVVPPISKTISARL